MAQDKGDTQFHVLGIALEMGYLIAVPLVGFALLGAFLDTTFHTKPLILLFSILLAIVISSVLVYRKTKEMIADAESVEPEAKTSSSKKQL